jgi:VWFA-related protein
MFARQAGFVSLLIMALFHASSLLSGTALQQSPQGDQPKSQSAAASEETGDSAVISKFKSQPEVVLVPVVVHDGHGRPIEGLSKTAFRVEENGKEQLIESFDEFKAEKVEASAPQVEDGYSNLPLDAKKHLRVTIVVLDLLNTTEIQRTDGKEQLIKFFSKSLRSEEPISLLCITEKGVRLLRPFTSDTASLIKALKELKIEGTWLGNRREAIRKTLDQLREIGQAYTGVPGRKTLIWATGEIEYPSTSEAYAGAGLEVMDDFQETWKNLMSANVAVYPIGLLSWSVDPAFRSRQVRSSGETLHSFSDATGGNICVESNDLDDCLNGAIEDSRSYYLLSYSLKLDDRKPGWRKLKVSVTADQAHVRARSGFYYGNPLTSKKAPAPHADEIAALASPLASSGVIMNVRVLPPGPGAGSKTTTHFLITIPLASVTVDPSRTAPLDLEVGAIALDKNMKEAGEFLHPVRGNPKPETLQQFAREGIQLEEKLELNPGTYDLRFVVRDNSTRHIGTVVFPFEAK